MKQKITIKNIIMLQAIIVLYTLSSIMAKFASGNSFLSFRFFLFYGLEIALIGIYAICWQQMIKRFDLSVAYANRAIALLWSMVWSVLIFKEQITIKNLLGVLLVIAGIMIINSDKNVSEEKKVSEKKGESHE